MTRREEMLVINIEGEPLVIIDIGEFDIPSEVVDRYAKWGGWSRAKLGFSVLKVLNVNEIKVNNES